MSAVSRVPSQKAFLHDRRGGSTTLLALAMVPLMTAVGAAVDYSRAASTRTHLQAAIDGALLAGAGDGSGNWTQVAANFFNGNAVVKAGKVDAPVFSQGPDGSYSGSVTAAVPTTFGILGVSAMTVRASAKVSGTREGDDSCIFTLDQGQPASHVGMTFNGAPRIRLTGCSIRSNTSITCNGHDTAVEKSTASGTATGCRNPYNRARTVPDIFAELKDKIPRACGSMQVGATWNPALPPPKTGVVETDAGGYKIYHVCGDLTVTGSGTLPSASASADTLIVIENGGLIVDDKTTVSTLRTAIIFTGAGASTGLIRFPNGNGKAATLTLSPPTSPGLPWQGIAMYQDPSRTTPVEQDWGPGANFNADGVVYLADSDVVMRGNGASGNTRCTKWVTNTFRTNGAVDLNFGQSSSACATIGMKQWSDVPMHLTN
jgi:hypothetical protein